MLSREPVHVRHFEKIAAGIDVAPVMEQISAHPELWDQHSIRKTAPGTPHNQMSDIWVRYNDVTPFAATGDYSRFNDAHIPIWYPAWRALPALRPIVFGLMARVQGEMLGGVLITRIPPGSGIAPHADRGWHVEYYDKFYLSLQSAPGAVFACEHDGVREDLNPRPGDLYLFDNRIMLITCIRTERFGRA